MRSSGSKIANAFLLLVFVLLTAFSSKAQSLSLKTLIDFYSHLQADYIYKQLDSTQWEVARLLLPKAENNYAWIRAGKQTYDAHNFTRFEFLALVGPTQTEPLAVITYLTPLRAHYDILLADVRKMDMEEQKIKQYSSTRSKIWFLNRQLVICLDQYSSNSYGISITARQAYQNYLQN